MSDSELDLDALEGIANVSGSVASWTLLAAIARIRELEEEKAGFVALVGKLDRWSLLCSHNEVRPPDTFIAGVRDAQDQVNGMISRGWEFRQATGLQAKLAASEKALRKLVNALRVRKVEKDWPIFGPWFERIDSEYGVGSANGERTDREAGR